MELVEYLESKDLHIKAAPDGNIYTHCWYCNEDESKRGRLYIQADPESEMYGAHYCHLCGAKGGLNAIRKHFGDDPIKSPNDVTMMRVAVEFYAEQLFENVEAYNYLTEKRGLTHEKIKEMKLGWADSTGLLTHLLASGFALEDIQAQGLVNYVGDDFLRHKIVIPYFSFGRPVAIRGKDMDGKYLSLPGSSARIYGEDAVRGEDSVVVAAGEFDAAVLQMLGYNACGIPGEKMWKPEWTELLVDAKRIYIMLDPDTTGKAAAEKLATTLGPRSRVVQLPDPKPGQKKIDVSKLFVDNNYTREDFDFLMSKAQGGLLISPAQAFDRWLEFEGNPTLEGLRFNIDAIDNEMQHGLLPGQVVTLLARTNVGKTLFSLNILHRMRMRKPDIKILFLSLEQMRNEWFERAHRIHSFYNPGVTTLDTVNYWKDNLYIVDENRISEEALEMCIEQYAYETGYQPDLVLIDYLGYYARSFGGEEYARTTSAIMGLKAIAKRHQLVVLAPHQANRSNDMGSEVRLDQGRGAGTVEETSDVSLVLWNPDQRKSEQEGIITKGDQKKELILKMAKSRDGGVNTMCVLQSAPLTLAIVPKGDPVFYERALRERQYWIAGMNYKDAIRAYLTGDERVNL
jgi:KaiC/GvpD/RAD55 family RecA-like ATPase